MKEAAKQYPKTVVNGSFEQPQRLFGLHTQINDGELAVDRVYPDSIGESAGIQVGDIIVSVDGTAVGDVTELINALHEGDRTKEITLCADGEEKTVTVTFPE